MARDDRLLGALSLCRKAGKLVTGFDATRDALRDGSAKLLLFAADVSPATRRRVLGAGEGEQGYPPQKDLPLGQNALARITRKAVGVLAVTDEGLAALVEKTLL